MRTDNGAFGYKNGLRLKQRKERVRVKQLLAGWLQHCGGMRRLNGVGESLGRGHGVLGGGGPGKKAALRSRRVFLLLSFAPRIGETR